MKKQSLFIALLLFSISFAEAQVEKINQDFGFGFHLSQVQNDFGLGVNVTSPTFLYNKVAVRARGNLAFLEHVENEETTWTPYGRFSIGFVSMAGRVADFIRLYGEGGLLLLVPNNSFSNESSELGGYGLFGFEFFFNKMGNYFVELGGAGTGAKADKIPLKPIYSNGFYINTGLRFYLN